MKNENENTETKTAKKWRYRFLVRDNWVYATEIKGDPDDRDSDITAINDGKFGRNVAHFNMAVVSYWEENQND